MSSIRHKFARIKEIVRILRFSYYTIKFNFHYLPFKQAMKLPIIFYNAAEFSSMKGTVEIKGDIKRGMIIIGIPNNPIYPLNSKFKWDNMGGECILHAGIGFQQGSSIRIGPCGKFYFGCNISIGPNCKFICFEELRIGDNVRMGWDILIMDTDFHHTFNLKTKMVSKLTKAINIEKNCWLGVRTILYKGTQIPKYTIVGANTVLNKKYNIEPFSLIAGSPVKVKATGVCRLLDDDVSADEIDLVREEYRFFINHKST